MLAGCTMSKCSDPDCREKLMIEAQNKVSKRSVWLFLISMLGVIAVLLVMWSDTRGIPADRVKAELREMRVTRLEEQVNALKLRQNDIYSNTQSILRKLSNIP